MELRARPTRAVVAAGVASTALLLAGVPGAEAQDTSGTGTVRTTETSKAAPASGTAKAMKTVTLVTGDQVMLDGAGKVTGVVAGRGPGEGAVLRPGGRRTHPGRAR